MMKLSSFLLILTIVANCAKVGDFCDAYDPVYMGRGAASTMTKADSGAAQAIAANNAYFERYCP